MDGFFEVSCGVLVKPFGKTGTSSLEKRLTKIFFQFIGHAKGSLNRPKATGGKIISMK